MISDDEHADYRNIKKKILFVPSNPSHVATQLPVVVQLIRSGHHPLFLSRDSLINKEYTVEHLLQNMNVPIVRYKSYYAPDYGRTFPKIWQYIKFKNSMSKWLLDVNADAVVICNDDAALFDRMIVDWFCNAGKQAFLIQESVRPTIRKIPISLKLKEQGASEIFRDLVQDFAFKFRFGPYFRKGYAHSNCTRIFTAGAMFRNALISDGIKASSIFVTGQPRLDCMATSANFLKINRDNNRERVLLYCNQPVKCSAETQERLFLDLVEATDAMDNVKLIVKLHPRDHPESHWMKLLRAEQGSSLLEVTRNRPLADCFERADAFVTIASTTCLEAMDYGLPVGLINYLPIEWYLPYERFGAVLSVKSVKELKKSIEILLFDESVRHDLTNGSEQVLLNELYLRDGKSACRIANQIELLLQ